MAYDLYPREIPKIVSRGLRHIHSTTLNLTLRPQYVLQKLFSTATAYYVGLGRPDTLEPWMDNGLLLALHDSLQSQIHGQIGGASKTYDIPSAPLGGEGMVAAWAHGFWKRIRERIRRHPGLCYGYEDDLKTPKITVHAEDPKEDADG